MSPQIAFTNESLSSMRARYKVEHVSKCNRHEHTLFDGYNDSVNYNCAGVIQKRVTFSDVSIHQHHMTLGDNPSVSSGVPVQIDWEPYRSITLTIDEVDLIRGESKRTADELIIPRYIREREVRQSGYSRDEISRVMECNAKINREIARSVCKYKRKQNTRNILKRVTGRRY
mmetsp:Transcript_5392/g.7275  ORF Transcript_5392/g.7275 Transcript_5392/m.7275 type:complete len:172 (-) Transcript_5392:344-859(-)